MSRSNSFNEKLILNFFLKIIDYLLSRYNKKNNILLKLKKFILSLKAELIYKIEANKWSILWDGKYITENLKKLGLLKAEIGTIFLSRNKIIHFGSINSIFREQGLTNLNKLNKIILTWFHIDPSDIRLKFVPLLNKKIDILHTSSIITKKKLVELGFDKEKIVVIPLGVDLLNFIKFGEKKKDEIKKKLNLPSNKIIIGSFQKDGVGWGEGLEPKLVKGPDIFCEIAKKIYETHDIHIFLTGPARGYVKKKLKEYQIPFTHIFLHNYLDIVECYNALDLYLITSRAEGGPKALLEGMATGVPIVTTNVGMAPMIIEHGINGFITDIEDIDGLSKYSLELIKSKKLRNKFISNGLIKVKKYSWEKVAKNYYLKIYEKLLDE